MINSELTQALSAMAYYTRMTAAGKPIRTDDQRLRMTGFFDPWTLKDYQTGELCNAKGQTWECYQAFSAAAYPQVSPQDPAFRTFFRPLHGKTVATAQPFVQPQGAYDMYRAGEHVWFNDRVWRCKSDTAYSPTDYKDAWEVL